MELVEHDAPLPQLNPDGDPDAARPVDCATVAAGRLQIAHRSGLAQALAGTVGAAQAAASAAAFK
jgi:hypothetical protein